MKKIKQYDKDGWSDDPLQLIKQLKKEMGLYLKAGSKPTTKMIKQVNKIDKIFKDVPWKTEADTKMDKKCQKK